MSAKASRISELWEGIDPRGWDVRYAAYFHHFNREDYYEAHDVLEELWLAGGRTASNYAYHKGLIQLAGAFVHLQKNRLGPAVALFNLAEANLQKYPSVHDACDVAAILALAQSWRADLLAGQNPSNPLTRRPAPQLRVPGE